MKARRCDHAHGGGGIYGGRTHGDGIIKILKVYNRFRGYIRKLANEI